MMQRILNSKNLVAFVLAAATCMTLYFRLPFPEGNIFLRGIALRSPSAFEALKYSYTLFLFSTPYIGYSVVLSGLYILRSRQSNESEPANWPPFPTPGKETISSSSSAKFTIPGNNSQPKIPSGSSSPRGACSLVLPSSAQSGREKQAAACIRSRTKFWLTAQATRKGGLVASSLR